MCRYTPACEEFICDISREPEARGNKLPNISRCIADIYTNWPWFILRMLNFDEMYTQRC